MCVDALFPTSNKESDESSQLQLYSFPKDRATQDCFEYANDGEYSLRPLEVYAIFQPSNRIGSD